MGRQSTEIVTELNAITEYQDSYSFYISKNIGELIAAAFNQIIPTNKDLIPQLFLNDYLHVFDCQNLALSFPSQPRKIDKNSRSRRLDLERKQFISLFLQEVLQEYLPPSLQDVARRLSHSSLVLRHHFPDLCSEIKLKHADYRKLCQQQKIQPLLENALHEFPPPPLLEIVRRLGYKSSGYLYRYYPELCHQITGRYLDYMKTCGLETRNRINQEIQTVAQLLHSQGCKPTQRRVTSLLTQPGVMINQYAQETLRQVQHSLGYD